MERFFNKRWRWLVLALVSLFLHCIWFVGDGRGPAQKFLNKSTVSLHVVATQKPTARPPAKSKPKPRPQPKSSVAAEAPPPPEKKSNATPTEAAVTNNGKEDITGSLTASLGPPSLTLAGDAQLIHSSYKTPAYTQAAIAAHYEDEVIARILVDDDGKVEEVNLTKGVKYGMDRPLIQSIYRARFTPATNEQGEAVRGWTEIRFRLVIP